MSDAVEGAEHGERAATVSAMSINAEQQAAEISSSAGHAEEPMNDVGVCEGAASMEVLTYLLT